jgi:hypothetical protein
MAEDSILGLLFKISADPKEAIAGMEALSAATVAESAEVSTLWSGAMKAITGPTGLALGAIVGLGGGMLELANKAAESGNQIYEASEKTGLAAENLSGLRAISKETGESFDALTQGMARAGRNLQAAIIEPGAISSKVLAQVMGGAKNLAALGLKPMDEALQTVLHRIFEVNNVGQQHLALSALFGKSWMSNIKTLKMLARDGYGPAIELAKKFHIFFDKAHSDEAHEYMLRMYELKSAFDGIWLELGEK